MPKNILYIADPYSIHDLKWITSFSNQSENYNAYLVYEKQHNIDFSKRSRELAEEHITLLPPIASFSLVGIISTIRSIIAIRKIINKHKIDIVHILFATPHAFWGMYVQVPFVITTRGSDVLQVAPSLKSGRGLQGAYSKILFKLLKSSFKRAKAVTSTSGYQISQIQELFSTQSLLVRTGVDVDLIQGSSGTELLHPSLSNMKYIFSPRFFSPVYNVEIQVNALQYLDQEIIDNYAFVFIKGKKYDADYSNHLQDKLLGLSESMNLNYLILDYLSQEEIWCYFQNTSLTIMTPISDGTPNSALEAMAAKSPLIIADLLHLDQDMFDDTCIKYKGNDPKILARLVDEALSNYPFDLVEKAAINVNIVGNRKTEMKKMGDLYKSI